MRALIRSLTVVAQAVVETQQNWSLLTFSQCGSGFPEPKSSDLPNPNVASVSAFGPSTKGKAHKNGAAGRGRTACSEEPKEAAGRA